MSFQAYLDNIKAKTGKTPDELVSLAAAKGLVGPGVKAEQIVTWLRDDYGLGRGHAMTIVLILKSVSHAKRTGDDAVARHFRGSKARWRQPYDELLSKIRTFGPDVSMGPTESYISLLRGGKKFAVVQITSDRLDIGIKLKGMRPAGRAEAAGTWNSMVTHRVRISEPKQIDREIFGWLRQAYELAASSRRG
ncbi:MAG TPA: DUF4287 domain-containing protein [Candidatus Dormibacteraeota bacterium]|nr:DUF4287 domain-containing protein [Candidatus Dormibacteraeota bacterium]